MATATQQQDETGVIDAEFTIIETPSKTPVSLYDVTDKAIAELKTELTGLTEYQAISKGIAKVRGLRVGIDNKRKQLKADSLAWGRRVDSEAKRIIEQLEAIEEPLKLLKHKADEAKEKAKQEAEAARIAENLRRVTAFRDLEYSINPFLVESMTNEEYAALLEIASDAHVEILRKRVQANAEAEAARLQAIADEAARVEALRVEREAIETERAKLEAEKAAHAEAMRKTEEANAAALAKIQADIEEANRIEADARAKREAEHAEANRLQEEALQAERDKLQAHWDKVAKDEAGRLAAEAAKAQAEAAKMQAEADERNRAEDDAKAEALRVEQEAADAFRLEAIKPDIQKIRAFGDMLRLLNYPVCASTEAQSFVRLVKGLIDNEAEACEEFQA